MTHQPVFPASLRPAALALSHVLPTAEFVLAREGFKVLVQGETLCAPARVYYRPNHLRSVIASSTGDTRSLAIALGTRHCDGYVREECLRQLVALDRPWIVPFIVQLLGEYVLKIVEVIVAVIPVLNAERFSEFVAENPEFLATTRRRATSYWACYYRHRFPKLQTYPGIVALDAIMRMPRTTS